MNLANKLTMLRVVLIPFFIAALMADPHGNGRWVALAIFIIASLTDFADGYVARKFNMITNFGKFMDALADKMLVCSALICLVEIGLIPAWIVIVIVCRDFAISGFRLVAATTGKVIAANYWGKFKTASQMVMICLLIANIQMPIVQTVTQAFIWISLILTIISLGVYIKENINVLSEE